MNIDSHRRHPDSDPDDQEREISLGTATILGIFLALALVCAAFFGFGYSMGRHAPPSGVPLAADTKPDTTPVASPESPFKNFKSGNAPSKGDDDAPAEVADSSAPKPATRKSAEVSPAHPVALPVLSQPTAGSSDPVVAATGQFVVQISAPSQQGDADALIAALNRKGYKAYIRKESKDNFLHVQVGPYATKPEAQAMVKRLDTDGYKPFIK